MASKKKKFLIGGVIVAGIASLGAGIAALAKRGKKKPVENKNDNEAKK